MGMDAEHWLFAVEATGGLSASALDLVREIHHSAKAHHTWRETAKIGSHLLNCVSIVTQRCTAMAVQASTVREAERAYERQGVAG